MGLGSIAKGLLGGSQKAKTKVQLPWWQEQAGGQAFEAAKGLAEQPYEKPPERVAPLPWNIQKAIGTANRTTGQAQPFVLQGLRQAGTAARLSYPGAATPFGIDVYQSGPSWTQPETYSKYMSPYIEGALAPAVRDLTEQYKRELLNTRARAAAQGALGGNREALTEGIQQQNYGRALGDLLSRGYQSAYESGRQAFETEREGKFREMAQNQALRQAELNRMLSSAGIMASGATTLSNLTTADLGRLMQTGQYQDIKDQARLDEAYQNFLEKRDWGERALNYYLSILGVQGGRTTTTKAGGASPFSQLVGLGLAGAGLAGNLGWAPFAPAGAGAAGAGAGATGAGAFSGMGELLYATPALAAL